MWPYQGPSSPSKATTKTQALAAGKGFIVG